MAMVMTCLIQTGRQYYSSMAMVLTCLTDKQTGRQYYSSMAMILTCLIQTSIQYYSSMAMILTCRTYEQTVLQQYGHDPDLPYRRTNSTIVSWNDLFTGSTLQGRVA